MNAINANQATTIILTHASQVVRLDIIQTMAFVLLATVVYLEATTHHAQMGSAIAKLVTQAQPATHASMAILQMLDLVQLAIAIVPVALPFLAQTLLVNVFVRQGTRAGHATNVLSTITCMLALASVHVRLLITQMLVNAWLAIVVNKEVTLQFVQLLVVHAKQDIKAFHATFVRPLTT